jgi:hypothetical protein
MEKNHLEQYPGDIEENPGGPIPLFLKLTYVGFTVFGLVYLFLYWAGDHSALVETFNRLTGR